jgi:hypothetical protein
VLYADTDYLIKDLTRPLESFLHEFEFYGKSPDIFVPRDGEQHEEKGNGKNGKYVFFGLCILDKVVALFHSPLAALDGVCGRSVSGWQL